MVQSQSPTLHNDSDYATFIERNLPFVDLHSGTDTPWWTLPLWGNYSSGYDTGVKMARRLLAFYGSGQVKADNTYLTHIVASIMRRQEKLNKPNGQGNEAQCLRGQYSGFFGELSKFPAPAAFINGCGITEKNDFEPVRLPCPLVPTAPDQTMQQTELPLPVVSANSISIFTMSSREIAELVNSRHDKVKQSIERLAERGIIQLPPMGDVKNHKGQTVKEYRIGKRDSYVIVAQLCPEFTACLVDRWQDLEQAAANGTLQ